MEFQAAFDDDKGTVKRPFGQYFIGELEIHILHIFVDSIENLISFTSRFIVRMS
jgi:hypothetical protein